MEFNKQNCECRTKTYLVKLTQSVCYYPVDWDCDKKYEDHCEHKRYECFDSKRKEHCDNCWEKNFGSKYWNETNSNSNYNSQENRHCCCKNRY